MATTATVYATTVTETASDDLAWIDKTNALGAPDADNATLPDMVSGDKSRILTFSGFPLAAELPATAVIDLINVIVTCTKGAKPVSDYLVQIRTNVGTGASPDLQAWTAPEATKNHSSTPDTWGVPLLRAVDLQYDDLQVQFQIICTGNIGADGPPLLDCVGIAIDYTDTGATLIHTGDAGITAAGASGTIMGEA